MTEMTLTAMLWVALFYPQHGKGALSLSSPPHPCFNTSPVHLRTAYIYDGKQIKYIPADEAMYVHSAQGWTAPYHGFKRGGTALLSRSV